MTCALGIEGSANKLGIGIMRGDKVLINIRKTFIATDGDGFVPRYVAVHHRKNIIKLIKRAFQEANMVYDDIDIICFTKGPGIASCLTDVAFVARLISRLWKKPIVAVNHCIGHIEMGRLVTKCNKPMILYASGGNTQVIYYRNNRYAIIGETMDSGVGNIFDKAARLLKLSNDPCPGYNIEQEAKKGKKLVDLPYVVRGMNFSFSGIISTIQTIISKENWSDEYTIADICFSLQETAFSMIIEVVERAMVDIKLNEILIVGGVGCNLRLQE
ncbi:hypothetical protein A3Q56_00323, partial [Intoshia linei]